MPGEVLAGVIVGAFTFVGSVVVALIAMRSNRQNTAVAFSATLITRLTAVEGRVAELETKLSTSQTALQAAIRFIDRLIEWGRDGGQTRTVPTPPAVLHEYLDLDDWDADGTNDYEGN